MYGQMDVQMYVCVYMYVWIDDECTQLNSHCTTEVESEKSSLFCPPELFIDLLFFSAVSEICLKHSQVSD